MSKNIYLLPAQRNIEAASLFGGLYANVGETDSNRTVAVRIKDADYARKAAGGEWRPLKEWKSQGFSDGQVRAALLHLFPGEAKSANNHNNTEELFFNTDAGNGIRAIELLDETFKFLTGKTLRALPQFVERGYQIDDITKIVEALRRHSHVCFTGFPGWGKSTNTPNIMAKLKDGRIGNFFLGTSPITDSIEGLIEAFTTLQYGDSNFLIITAIDGQFVVHRPGFPLSTIIESDIELFIRNSMAEGYDVVFLLSVQNLRSTDESRIENDSTTINSLLKEKFNFLYTIPILLWIRDEYHKEYRGFITKQVFAGIAAQHILDMTATPYHLIGLGLYTKDQIIGDTMLHALKKKKEGNPDYQEFPEIKLEVWNGLPLRKTEFAEIYTKEEEWDPRKLHAIKNGQLCHVGTNVDLNRQMYGHVRLPSGKYIESDSKEKNPLSIFGDSELSAIAKETGYHVLAEGDSEYDATYRCNKYVEVLNSDPMQRMHYVTSHYLKTEAHKNRMKVVDLVAKLKLDAMQTGKRGIIIVTHRMLLTGSDINFLGHIVLLDKMGSLNDFLQLLGRMFRTHPGKLIVKVFVACPGMDVSIPVYEAAKAEAIQYGDGDPREYYDLLSITEYNEFLQTTKVSYDALLGRYNEHMERLLAGDWYSRGYFSQYPELDELVKDFDFKEFKGSNDPKTSISVRTDAKVHKSIRELEDDNKKRKLGKNWKETVATMLNESIRLANSNQCPSLKEVFETQAAQYEFGQSNIWLIQTLFEQTEFYHAVNTKFKDRMSEIRDLGYE